MGGAGGGFGRLLLGGGGGFDCFFIYLLRGQTDRAKHFARRSLPDRDNDRHAAARARPNIVDRIQPSVGYVFARAFAYFIYSRDVAFALEAMNVQLALPTDAHALAAELTFGSQRHAITRNR